MKQDLASIKQKVNEINTMQQRPPPRVGYDQGNALILINAFGKPITLPMEFCWSPDVSLLQIANNCTLIYNVQELHETLIRLFQGKIGQDYVERHDYSISTEDGLSMVTSNDWGAMMKNGMIIVMSMIVKKVALEQEGASRQRNTCPRCYETRVGVMVDDGWLHWCVIIVL